MVKGGEDPGARQGGGSKERKKKDTGDGIYGDVPKVTSSLGGRKPLICKDGGGGVKKNSGGCWNLSKKKKRGLPKGGRSP